MKDTPVTRVWFWFEQVGQDVRIALRTIRRDRIFALAAVSTLALGIGATTAIFGTANAALLRPLPYPDWQDIRTVRTAFTDGNLTSGLVAPVEVTRMNDPALPIVRAVASLRRDATLLLNDDAPMSIVIQGVTQGFFELFGLPNTIGSGFTDEHYRPGGRPGAVISHRLWREVFSSDPAIVGKSLRLADGSVPILAVAARDMAAPADTDVWVNMSLPPEGTAHSFEGYLRVRPRTNPEALRAALATMAVGLARDYPGPETNRAFIVQPLVNAMVGDLRPILLIVLSATGLLLLLSCVNVTNLLLARGARRTREILVRSTLGATRGRIVRQLLTESAVLAFAGAVAGVLLAYVGVRVLLAYGASNLPRLEAVSFDVSVLLFAAGTLVISALVVGLAPSLQVSGAKGLRLIGDVGRALRGTRFTRRALRVMIVAEVALAVTLVAGAGWLVRSFTNLQSDDPGFSPEGRVIFDVRLPFARYQQPEQRSVWIRTLLGKLRAIEGVESAGSTSGVPMRTDNEPTPLVQVQGSPERPGVARRRTVSPGFFEAMGIQLRSGRVFTEDDRQTTAQVAIVNETFVRRYLQGRDPLTTEISFGFPTIVPATRRAIVGVVQDVKYASLWSEPEPAFYVVPDQIGQLPGAFSFSVIVSTRLADPAALVPAIRAAVRETDPLLPFAAEDMSTLVASTLTRQRLGMTLMLLFGLMALALAAIGIYGVIAYASAERRGEVATRMALGASPSSVFWLLIREGRTLAIAGAVLGAGAAYASGRLASNWLYEVQASDRLVLPIALALVLGVTIVAILIPARRASRTSPAYALSSE